MLVLGANNGTMPKAHENSGYYSWVVMFWPGLASKPWLWPGLRQLQLAEILSQAMGHGFGLVTAWLGLGHGFSALFSLEFRNMKTHSAVLQNLPARPTPPAPPRPSSSPADWSDSVSTSPYIPRPRSSLATAHTKSASTSQLNGVSGRSSSKRHVLIFSSLICLVSSVSPPSPRAGRFTFPVTDFPPPRPFTDQPRTYNGSRKRGSDFDTSVLHVR